MIVTCHKCGISLEVNTAPLHCYCGGVTNAGNKPAFKARSVGVGSCLEAIIPEFFSSNSCNCKNYARKMDRWGVVGCEERFNEIVEHLVSQSKRIRGLKHLSAISRRVAGTWLRAAIDKANMNEVELVYFDSQPINESQDWSVAITTAPRVEPTLEETITATRKSGWEPVVFAEPGSIKTNCTTIWNTEKKGIWRNWIGAAKWAVETGKPYILTLQDDISLHPDTMSFLEPIIGGREGFVSLYTPKHYSQKTEPGINRIRTKSLWGACALAWRREELERVLSHRLIDSWHGAVTRTKSTRAAIMQRRKENPSLIANSDTAIGKIMNQLKMPMWFIDPSPASHTAKFSTIKHGDNKGRRNCGRCADHSIPLADQVPL